MADIFFEVDSAVSVSDSPAVLSLANPNVLDNVTVAENVVLDIPVLFSVFDTATISEVVTPLIPILVPSVFDSTTVSETITLLIPTLFITPSQAVTVSEIFTSTIVDTITGQTLGIIINYILE